MFVPVIVGGAGGATRGGKVAGAFKCARSPGAGVTATAAGLSAVAIRFPEPLDLPPDALATGAAAALTGVAALTAATTTGATGAATTTGATTFAATGATVFTAFVFTTAGAAMEGFAELPDFTDVCLTDLAAADGDFDDVFTTFFAVLMGATFALGAIFEDVGADFVDNDLPRTAAGDRLALGVIFTLPGMPRF